MAVSGITSQKFEAESDTESLELDYVALSPSSSIDSRPSPTNVDDSEEEHFPSYTRLRNDDLSQKQGKAPIIRSCHYDEGLYVSNISIGPGSQAVLPTLITRRKKSDYRKDMARVGTRVWEPSQLEQTVLDEYETYCRDAVATSLPYGDETSRNARYMQDKAFEILHDTNYDVFKAREIVAQNLEFITKPVLCTPREETKIERGIHTHGRNFRLIRNNFLEGETVSHETLVNYYYLNKKRINAQCFERSTVVFEEEESDDDEVQELLHNVQAHHFASEDFEQSNSLDLISPPPSPLSALTQDLYNDPSHHFQFESYEEGSSSASCEEFFIPIECSGGTSPVNFSTYCGDENVGIDDLFSLSNNL